jgi:iturin family lipopeptide synthetase A
MKENRKETGLEAAVIGMSARLPGAAGIDEFWHNLENGIESITFFTEEELKKAGLTTGLLEDPNYVKAYGEFQDKEYFDNFFFGYTPKEAESMDPQIRVFHECSWEALEKAGYDPTSYEGSIAVYAGASDNFSWRALEMIKGMGEGQGAFGTSLFNNALLFLSTSLSYKLDLTGPSLTFFTACSTSLVAVHLACRALATGECDMALAGGVSITGTNKRGYQYREGMIFSPDGHCRTFDAKAQGMLFGEGVGVVVLKRLKDAVAHRDNIIAVVKGSSVNNDGTEKASFTAPSKKTIAGAARKALAISRVEPETITYIEAHGTATPLGDPIEIGALTRAFKTGKKQYCRIGSVKSNIGHLDVAAGIAGFIKTVLALKYRLIPPSLHFETANPKIEIENSPFKVNTQLYKWDNIDAAPLRAGVNSAGFGGTNAFVILEEAPPAQDPPRETGTDHSNNQLILLSAKTQTALEKMTENLAEYFEKNLLNPGLNLADAAYTLQVGRKAFQNRKMLVCTDSNDAIAQLSNPDPARVKTFLSRIESRDIIFMFPGQGTQYVEMALDLYEKEPIFQQEMDRCFEILNGHLEYKIKDILYPDPLCRGGSPCPPRDYAGPPGQGFNRSNRSYTSYKSEINQTGMAQPLIFTVEYALAKLLGHWGVKPGYLIGHSIGEYVAASLSGVFSLEDALALVALRGKLMQGLPGGAMLSAAVSLETLTPLLNENKDLSLAAVNGPAHCVVSGPEDAIAAIEQLLSQKGHQSTRLHTSHAFHSKMMEPIMAQYEEAIAKITLHKPQIPFISNLTGDWITAEQVTTPAYWANHLRKTVYFSDGLKKLLEKDNSIFVEVGPGQVLSKLVKQHPDKSPGHLVINLVRHPKEEVGDDYFLLDKIGMLWLYGIKIHWPGFYVNEKRHRKPLPTYPFERQRYWIEGNLFSKISEVSTRRKITKKTDISDWFYEPLWKQAAAAEPVTVNSGAAGERSCWLVFADPLGIGTGTADLLRKQEQDVVLVKIGKDFKIEKDSTGTYTYTVNPTRPGDYKVLFEEIGKLKKIPRRIVHLWSLRRPDDDADKRDCPGGALTAARAMGAQEQGFYSLLYLVKGLKEENAAENLHLTVVTNNMQPVCGEEYILPGQSTVLGPVNVIPQEKPSMSCSSIDIALPHKGKWQRQKLLEQLLAELSAQPAEKVVALRDNRRWLPTYEPIRLPEPGNQKAGIKEKGVYLVTGGLGRIGLVLAEYLARTVKAKLILTGRSAFPPEHEWDQWLTTHQETDKITRGIRAIRKIRELGGQVLAVRADVAKEEEMQAAVLKAGECFGPLNGVIHSAGVDDGSYFKLFEMMEKPQCEAHFQPKIRGLIVLARVLEGKKLDFVLIMSSLSAVLGGLGFSAYSAANIFMDHFLESRNRENSFPWLSVNWDAWKLDGPGIEELSMDKQEGIQAFQRVLTRLEQGRLIHSLGDLQARIDRWIKLKDLEQKQGPAEETSPTHSLYARENLSSPYTAPRSQVEKELLEIWQNIFGFGNLGIHDDFFELGGDSLSVMTVSAKIHKKLNVEVPLTEFFSSPTIEKLARYINTAGKDTFFAIEPVETKEYYPVSPTQKRMYILQQMEKDSIGYNETETFFLEDTFDKEKFESVFSRVINRHESLRTSFHMIGNRLVQGVHNRVPFEIEYYDLTTGEVRQTTGEKAGTNPSSSYVIRHLFSEFIRPFDLSRAPLLRVGLIKLPHTPAPLRGHPRRGTYNSPGVKESKYFMMVDMHHIVTDGTSLEILLRELTAFYSEKELFPSRLQYKDFAEWQNAPGQQELLKRQETYWLQMFTGELPILNMPTDYPRPAIQSFAGNSLSFTLSEAGTNRLKDTARAVEATLYMVILAVFTIMLSKLGGQEDIMVGTPVAARRHADLEQIIGAFVNTLVMRNYPEQHKTFMEFLKEVKNTALNAYDNQEYPFEDLVDKAPVKRDLSRNPLFDVMFVLHNELESAKIPRQETVDLKVKPYKIEKGASQFDMMLIGWEGDNYLRFTIEYCTKLFKEESIRRFAGYFKKVCTSVTAYPGNRISAIDILAEEERERLLVVFNDTAAAYPKDKTLHELFAGQVEKTPGYIAVLGTRELHREGTGGLAPLSGLMSITYGELNEKSNRLAHLLIEKGTKPDTIVAIMMERSIDMIIAILGILKAGGAYMPIDPDYPEERINYMIADSAAKILMTSDAINRVPTPHLSSHPSTLPPFYPSGPSNLAYIIYTSGSTGKPKGVLVEHRSAVNILVTLQREYPLGEKDTYLFKTSYLFDISVTELFGWFLDSGRLAVLEKEGEKDPGAILAAIQRSCVTHINFVPSMFNVFVDGLNAGNIYKLSALKYIFLGGEALLPVIVDKFRQLNTNIPLENIYGPTEATVYSSRYSLSHWDGKGSIPIGKPLPNTSLYILDKGNGLQPIGIPGELCISGIGVAPGYLNRPELTADRFVRAVIGSPKRPSKSTNDRFYKTGDLVRWLPDGCIEFHGRLDHQVKLRGFRIELGEIENALLKHEHINEAVIIQVKAQYLYAYIVAGREFNVSELKEYLLKEMPDYMVPSYFVKVDKIPLTPNGKVDRLALASMGKKAVLSTGVEFVAPRNEIENKIADTWKELLNLEEVGIDENFFDLGGTSLDIIRLSLKFKEAFNVNDHEVVLRMFRYPTIRALSEYWGRKETGVDDFDTLVKRSVPISKMKKTRTYQKDKRRRSMYGKNS